MAKAFKARMIVRCPFCYSGASPVHVGCSVYTCPACGQTFRVVHARGPGAGKRLSKLVDERVKYKR